MSEPSVSVRNLTKSFGERKVVDDLSFDVQKGEVFALLGHNGAGKSTTIDLILGLKAPDGGSAKILGMDAARHRKQVFERVGVQLQNTEYQPNITVEEACIEYASLYAAPADYPQLLEQFGLGALRKNFVSGLSGGERQRISIARALLKNAPIVLLDEATASLDVENETKVQSALSRLLAGKTVLVIAHRMRTVAGADHIVVLENGRVAEQGTPAELMEKGTLYRHMVELQSESSRWKLG